MKKAHLSVIMLAAVVVIARGLLLFADGTGITSEKELPTTHSPVLSPTYPKGLSFAGEVVPVGDVDVAERLDRELLVNTYWHSNTVLSLKRANRYFPMMEAILKKNGVPEDFKYLALIESGLTNVVSPAGATGFWQIMKATGIQYGLEISSEIDERYHLERSTEVACLYLKEAYTKFGSWTAAAASYNMGMGGLQKQMNRQNANDYYDLLLNAETSRYVFRILAVKVIFENPTAYGFFLDEKDLYTKVPESEVDLSLPAEDLAEFASAHGISYKALKIHNPWLRQSYLKTGKQRSYRVKIPDARFYGSNNGPSQKVLPNFIDDSNNSEYEDVGD
ncbi:MAG: lytic transglycosylase domain-containing protein [Schleiferiaceae bacterium]|nr:lytic transglycosylase domain-containing protein [Schleiferiaceae bacterium]